ncbi:hypothetical protein M8J77_018513 [Diaphorina citri]|nr:hypothetical protein M8J77_018513 [Diaphorina citri]
MSYWDKYKSSHEPKEHWSLRKKFLETHKDSFDEDRLLCLAQVFYNVEFLGCRYPDAVMKQIEELSQGIADDHGEQKKSKLQRTFVQASEAAESKVCRTGIKRKHEDGDSSVPNRPQGGQSIHDVLRNRYEPPPQVTASGLDLHSIESYLSRDPPVSQLILVRMKNESALTFEYLQRSTKFSQMNMDFAFIKIQENQFEAALKLGTKTHPGVKLVSIPATSITKPQQKILKARLLELADALLTPNQFTIVINNQFYSSQDAVEKVDKGEKAEGRNAEETLGGSVRADTGLNIAGGGEKEERTPNFEGVGENFKGGGGGGGGGGGERGDEEVRPNFGGGEVRRNFEGVGGNFKGGGGELRPNFGGGGGGGRGEEVRPNFGGGEEQAIMGGQKESEDKKYISDGYEKLAENNIGSKLLKLMGWSGSGGLGKNAQGISEPVPITGRLDKKRSGLGQDLPLRTIRGGDGDDKIGLSVQKQIGLTGASFKHWVRDLLSEYLNSPHLLWFEDLIFSSSFSKEERATLHSFCQTNQYRNQLVAKSYGRDEERHLVISRKLAKNGRAILADLIRCGDNEKFSLVIPENFYKWNGG